jgi:hypothetical protein
MIGSGFRVLRLWTERHSVANSTSVAALSGPVAPISYLHLVPGRFGLTADWNQAEMRVADIYEL